MLLFLFVFLGTAAFWAMDQHESVMMVVCGCVCSFSLVLWPSIRREKMARLISQGPEAQELHRPQVVLGSGLWTPRVVSLGNGRIPMESNEGSGLWPEHACPDTERWVCHLWGCGGRVFSGDQSQSHDSIIHPLASSLSRKNQIQKQ